MKYIKIFKRNIILTILKLFYRFSSFKNLLQYIITTQPWSIESDPTKPENKTESDLTKSHILICHLQPLHIVATGWTKHWLKHYHSLTTIFDNYIQTQCNSDSDASAVENDVASSGLDQIMNHNCNTDIRNNDDSQSYETPWKTNPFLLFWWYNLHHKHTIIFQTASTWKIIYIF